MTEIGVLGVFCGSAALTGILISTYFLLNKKMNKNSRLMLSLLFLAISMRIAKSIWHYILSDYAKLGVSQGLIALAIIGPALLFYLYFSTNKIIHKRYYLHWVWPILALWIALLEPISFRYLYRYGTYLIVPYLIFAAILHRRTNYSSRSTERFNLVMILGVCMIVASFLYQLTIDNPLLYAYGAAFASLIIYVLLFLILTQSSLIYKNQSKEVSKDAIMAVREAFEMEKVYLRPGITLNDVAIEIDLPAYLISPSVNKAYNKSFPEAVNFFRVTEVKRRLQNGDHKKLKIEGLATEAGFTTPSAFYAAFKKETGLTPTQFQKTLQ
jgi:AraC-like DNA-binding protein